MRSYKLLKKIETSSQFREIAFFIQNISNVETGELTAEAYQYLCECPFTGKELARTVQNINTNLFCQLFEMKPTSCERNLRLYKELTRKEV